MTFEDRVKDIQSEYTGKSKSNFRYTRIGGSIGLVAGIVYCVIRRKGTWGYVAYTFLFTMVGSTLGTAIGMGTDAEPIEGPVKESQE